MQYKRLPFEWINAPAVFQRLLYSILRKKIETGKVKLYIDDIIIFTNDLNEHYEIIRRVFRKLAERNIIFNLKKSTFLQPKAEYLDYVFDHEGVSPNKNTQKVIDELTTPTTKNDLQKVLGILNYHSKFIPNYSHKVNLLNKLLHGKAQHEAVNWQSKHTQILDEIRKELQGQVKLFYRSLDKDFQMYTDASAHAIAWYLTQGIGKDERVITRGKRTLTLSKQKKPAIDRELLALELGAKKIAHLTSGREVKAFTDHKPLTQLV